MKEQNALKEKFSEFKKNLNARLDERIKNRKRPTPEPRYDDVYFEGLEWLDRQ